MKKAAVIAMVLGLFAAPAAASAETFTSRLDPSGARMCFDSDGDKAPLARCDDKAYTLRQDPSGAAMCFDSDGDKAPLAQCERRVATNEPRAGAIERIAAVHFNRH